MSGRPSWPLSRVAAECGVSVSTVRRALRSGRFPGSFQDTRGAWMVPVDDLLAAGFQPQTSPPGDHVDHGQREQVTMVSDLSKLNDELQGQITYLQNQVANEQARREAVEQVNTVLRDHVDSLKMALRQIEAARPEPLPVKVAPPQREPATPPAATSIRSSVFSGLFRRGRGR